MYDISLVLSYSRPKDIPALLKSLESNLCKYQVVMVGDRPIDFSLPDFCKVIQTPVKPAQCWEIGARFSSGRIISWTADDAEYSEGALDQMVKMLDDEKDHPIIGAFRTIENGEEHTGRHLFRQQDVNSPLMAPVGACERGLYMKIGGIDRRFITGQWENDLSMKVYELGGKVMVCPDAKCFLDHNKKHEGRSTMSRGYDRGRDILNTIWDSKYQRVSPAEPFSEADILIKSEGENKSCERTWA